MLQKQEIDVKGQLSHFKHEPVNKRAQTSLILFSSRMTFNSVLVNALYWQCSILFSLLFQPTNTKVDATMFQLSASRSPVLDEMNVQVFRLCQGSSDSVQKNGDEYMVL